VLTPVITKSGKHAELFVDAVQRLFTVFPKKTALKIAGMSSSAFYDRLVRVKFKCGLSPLDLCLKKHPVQLAAAEIRKIKALFADPRFVCWPAVSMYYEGLRNLGPYICLSTFYKYVNLLGLKRRWKKAISKTAGIRADRPNRYLHVDTTYWGLDDGTKAAIAFVSDNFSKAILGWNVSLKNGAENVKRALEQAIYTIRKHHPDHLCATLVADGGGENHAVCIEEFLQNNRPPEITKIIAQKDIRYSNSPVEAINKIVKRYLRHYDPRTFSALIKCLAMAVEDYTYKRPHGSLKGLTPFEAYTQPLRKPDFRARIKQARSLRVEQNRNAGCQECGEAGE